ncbi:MAG: alpha/beta hydrolase [Nitrospiraceae bacterium]|nr:alpha/beta hydrolase [Nitrospiraceae bacterium]
MSGKVAGDEWEGAAIIRGKRDMPWAVFVHGLGVDKRIWAAPEDARILGGLFPLRTLLRTGGLQGPGAHQKPTGLRSLYHDLALAGFTTVAFSFKRPAGRIEEALAGLEALLDRVREEKPAGQKVVLVGHSRGALVISKYLERPDPLIKGFVSIAGPHKGTTLARWAVIAAPAAMAVKALRRGEPESRIGVAVNRMLAFIQSPAVAELLPGSAFFAGLRPPRTRCPSVSAGGTDPRFFNLLGIGFPEALEKIAPGWAVPDEIKDGLGDGLVSAESAVCPHAREHLNFHLNHAETVFDREARAALLKRITGFF